MALEDDMESITSLVLDAIRSEVLLRAGERERLARIGEGVRVAIDTSRSDGPHVSLISGRDIVFTSPLLGLMEKSRLFNGDFTDGHGVPINHEAECQSVIAGLMACVAALQDRLIYFQSLKR